MFHMYRQCAPTNKSYITSKWQNEWRSIRSKSYFDIELLFFSFLYALIELTFNFLLHRPQLSDMVWSVFHTLNDCIGKLYVIVVFAVSELHETQMVFVHSYGLVVHRAWENSGVFWNNLCLLDPFCRPFLDARYSQALYDLPS